jgi:hypothetical protein
MCNHFFFDCTRFFSKFSTSTQPFCPRVQTTVASSLPATVSKIRHFMSSTLGQGQSLGRGTQSKVVGHRYCEHNTKWSYGLSLRGSRTITNRHTAIRVRVPRFMLLLLLLLLLLLTEHFKEVKMSRYES